ncbi:MAG TPA: four helix bundle suffix domain-containing protein, partial [Armatimonadota bacterium]
NYLLDKQIAALEAQFIEEGGYSEQLAKARLAERNRLKQNRTDKTDKTDRTDDIPSCRKCGKAMVLHTAQKGERAGKQFWGCSAYPDCKGLIDL